MVYHDGSSNHSPDAEALYAEKEVNHQSGLEVDHTHDRLRTVLDTAGLETVPAEYRKEAIPQTGYEGAEKEAWNDGNKEVYSPNKSNEPGEQSVLKRWKLWGTLTALLVIIVVVAVAVPLSVRHKSR